MSITLNTRTYTADRISTDVVVYAGPAHSFSSSDTLELKRVLPKPTKDFAGVARPSLKLTKSVETDAVAGTRANAIITLSGSLPVGMTAEDVDALFADIAAAAASPTFKDAFKKLQVNF